MIRRVAPLIVLLALFIHPAIDSAQNAPPASSGKAAVEMADAVLKFWNALTPEQQAKAGFEFGNDERENWHFTPVTRKGLPWKEMTPAQIELGHALLKLALSQRAYDKAEAIQQHETILGSMETNGRNVRDPTNYYLTIFGKPGKNQPWGWRFEGHHVAFNFTVADGKAAVGAPNFFGSNPAKVPGDRPKAGLRILAAEEDLGRKLVLALDDGQRKMAIFEATAPGEIITKEERRPSPLPSVGIPAAQLNADQKKMLMDLVTEYSSRLRSDMAAVDMQKIQQAGVDNIYFGWAGTTEVGGPHYYRVQGPTFLIEYDNTQNNANHIHAVWRDPANDFGRDLLRQHYAQAHAP